jgi:hypothetical protein
MKQWVGMNRDIFYMPGVHRALQALLAEAETEPDCRTVLREIGADLREDGEWRGTIKRAAGWDGHKTAWAALEAYIKARRTDNPWWDILNYADGESVPWFEEGRN